MLESAVHPNMIDINKKNIGINTDYCFDSNGNAQFKCECNEGFDGKRCQDQCFLECGENGICTSAINGTTGIKQWECLCLSNCAGKTIIDIRKDYLKYNNFDCLKVINNQNYYLI